MRAVACISFMAIVQLFCTDTNAPVEHEPTTHTDDAIPAPLFETFCVAIPTAIGAWCTYSVITGDRSPHEWSAVLARIGSHERISMIIRNACAQLTPHELGACIACTGALIAGCLCTVANLSATIVCLIKGCRDTKLRRQQWLKFANATVNRALVGALCVSISVCCLALLGDYKQAGDAPQLPAL